MLKKIAIIIGLTLGAILITLTQGNIVAAEEVAQSYIDLNLGMPAPPLPSGETVISSSTASTPSLVFFTNRLAFNGICCPTLLALEDFEQTNIGPNSIVACPGPFNSTTNDACFSTGAILNGISIDSIPASGEMGEMVVITPFVFGVTSSVVGPNYFSHDTEILFPNNDVKAVGMDILAPLAPGTTVSIQIFGIGDTLLGVTTATALSPPGAFWGVISNQIITRITLSGALGELIGNVAFGLCELEIDIKPGSDPNSINCDNDKQVITVAILTTDYFDATTVDHTTVTFEGASEMHIDRKSGEPRSCEEDVDRDGDIDLVFHFRLSETNLTCESTEGVLKAEIDGIPISGTDSVHMVD